MSTVDTSTSSLNSGFGLGVSGLSSGFDWHNLITELMTVERAPETLWKANQTTLNNKNAALGDLVTEMTTFQGYVNSLNDPTLYDSRTATAANSAIASATASTGTATGTYTFNITQLATAATLTGQSGLNGKLNSSNDVSSVVLSSANFRTAVTAGTFTVNGNAVTISTTDTLQAVFDKIHTATANAVTATYDPTADKITLSSSSPITLGSSADTSNFLQVARLYTNDSGTVTSQTTLGAVRTTVNMNIANLATTVQDGGSGKGAFTINGVTINFSATADSLQNVLDRINASTANVTASYDSLNSRLTLTNKNTGNTAITVNDVTGNFLAATKLSTGTAQNGTNLTYSVNGGASMTSLSNTITPDSSGVTGLSVTALGAGSTTITVATNTTPVKTAITNFVSEYNKLQSMIDNDTASTANSTGKVVPGVFTGDSTIEGIATALRSMIFNPVSGINGAVQQLNALGYDSNGVDNTLSVTDSTKLDSALANNLADVKAFFTTASTGVAAQFNTYLASAVGGPSTGVEGTLPQVRDSLTAQSTNIDTQIATLEKRITADQARYVAEFTNMEQIRTQLNTQLAYLSSSFGTSSTISTPTTSSSSSG